jgi:hypothetical protein
MLGFFSLFKNSDRLAGTFRESEDPENILQPKGNECT